MSWWIAGIILIAGAFLIRDLRTGERRRQLGALVRATGGYLAAATAVLILLLMAARRYVEVRDYLVTTVLGTLLFTILTAVFLTRSEWTQHFARRLSSVRPVWIALGFGILAAVAGKFVLGDIPHVSDEVAYQFQARSMANGGLAMTAPSIPEAFNFLHLMIHNGQWYGIMNPGWPALLAIGELAGAPWVINPLLGALCLLVFGAFFREAGIDRTEGRLAVWLMAILPLLIFMSGTYMSHPANLLLFGAFCWAWARMLNRESIGAAAIAGVALAINLLVRPVDSAVVTLPFLLQLLFHIRRRPRLLFHAATVGVLAGGGIAATLLYNRALTGDAMVMPVTQYFTERNPAEHFGIGFGPQMGTKLHGEEWPGFTPVDGVRVSAYRLVEFLKDLYGIPLVVLAALLAGLRRPRQQWGEWRLVLIGSGLALFAVYFMHFYHGLAYGSRHYYLAVPAIILVLAHLLAATQPGVPPGGAPRAALLALVVTTVTFTAPPLVREYGDAYRGSSPSVAAAVKKAQIHGALIFVEPGAWSWKSAFPLNRYPLETADLIFARDRGPANAEVMALYPSRSVYYLATGPADQVTIRPAPGPTAEP